MTEDLDLIHEDEAILVLNKPAGLPVLPDGWVEDSDYLVRRLENRYGKIWIVHRLDKVTSGVIVFAFTAEAHRQLSLQFDQHQTEKIYRLIVNGSPTWSEKAARHPLRINVGHRHRSAVDPKRGKPSETRFEVLERLAGQALLEARPLTGRTHQIRVHAYALGHPLLGDVLYGAPQTELIARPALHAYSLSITHPQTGQPMTFTAGYPADFEKALKTLRGE